MEIKEIDLIRIKLEPGETLVVKVKSNEVGESDLWSLGEQLRKTFPNNKVALFCVREGDDIELTAVKETSYSDCSQPQSYCTDCSCGKKERIEGEK